MRCTRCSYCKWIPFDLVKSHAFSKGCPSVEANHFHSYSAGGRLITSLSLMDGRSEVTDRVVDIAFKCQLCGNCDVACKLCRYDMEPVEALHELRAHLVEQGRVPGTYPPLIERVRAGNRGEGRAPAERSAWSEGLGLKDLSREKGEILFFAGCRFSFEESLRPAVRTAARVLLAGGADLGVLPETGCCGGLAYHMGYRGDFAAAGERMLEVWAAAGVTTVVTPCADCYHTFKRLYPKLGGDVEVLHSLELAARLIDAGSLEMSAPVDLTVTYHDPCHLGRQGEPHVPWDGVEKKIYGQAVVYDPPRPRYNGAQGIYQAPRDVLFGDPRPRAGRDGSQSGGRLVLRRRRRLPRGVPGVLGLGGVGARRRSRGHRRRRPRHGLLALRAQLRRGRGRGRLAARRPRRAGARRTGHARRGGEMTIAPEAYRALEDAVGATHVSADPAVLDSYAFQYLAELIRPEHSHFMARPAAVVLPGSTEEVQAVVRLANRHGLKVKPTGTGWYLFNAPMSDDAPTLQLDLRRMGSIVEFDEENLFAVVEPYVIHAQLQAEALKRGLNINVPGSGCSTSIVASACAYAGQGPFTYFMGGNSENVLGMEWVTPEGEIVRTGSLGSGDGWFSGEGPGPSVRGICRGSIGSRGGLGVYTKCAIKLGPSYGPHEWKVGGTLPAYRLPVAETQRAYTIAVPSWDAWADAYYEIYDNELGYIFHRQFNLAGAELAPAFWLMYNDHARTLGDVPDIAARPEVQDLREEMRISFQLILAGTSVADIELQDRILDEILGEVGGRKVERFCAPDMAEFTNMYLQRLGHKHINFVWAGGYIGSWMQFGTPDWVKGYVPAASAGLERDAAAGLLVQCGGDAMMGSGSGIPGGGEMGLEQFVSYDPLDPESVAAASRHMEDAVKDAAAIGYPPGQGRDVPSGGLE